MGADHPCRQVVEVVIPPYHQRAEGVGLHDPSGRDWEVARALASVEVVVGLQWEPGPRLVAGRVLEPGRVRALVLAPA